MLQLVTACCRTGRQVERERGLYDRTYVSDSARAVAVAMHAVDSSAKRPMRLVAVRRNSIGYEVRVASEIPKGYITFEGAWTVIVSRYGVLWSVQLER